MFHKLIIILLYTCVLISFSSVESESINKDTIILQDGNGKNIIHQNNGITIYGKLKNDKLDGIVQITYRKIEDIKNLYKVTPKKRRYDSIDSYVLNNLPLFEELEKEKTKKLRDLIFLVKHKINFKNGSNEKYSTMIYSDGTKILTRIKIIYKNETYIEKIISYGISKIILPNKKELMVEINNNKIVKILDAEFINDLCRDSEIKITKNIFYDSCIDKEKYNKVKTRNIGIIKKHLREMKVKSERLRRVRNAKKTNRYDKIWKKALKKAPDKVDVYNNIYDEQKKIIEKIFIFKDKNILLYEEGFLNSWVIARPLEIYSRDIVVINQVKKIKLDDIDQILSDMIRSFILYSIDIDLIKDYLIKSSGYLEEGVYLLPNYHGSPFVDEMGNIYISDNKNYSKDEIYVIMLHGAIHIASYSIIKSIFTVNATNSMLNKYIKILPQEYREIFYKHLQEVNILRDSEEENDIILLEIISKELPLINLHLSSIKNNKRRFLIENIANYYRNGGRFSTVVKTLALVKILSAYKPPKHNKKLISIPKSSDLIEIDTIQSSFSIKKYNIEKKNEFLSLMCIFR